MTKICTACGKLFDTYLKKIATCGKACAASKTIQEKFFDQIQKTDTCWLWLGCKTANGYGQFYHCGQWILAHRYAYAFWKGFIPGNKVPDHMCYVRNCVNPDHLEAVTDRENLLRGTYRANANGVYRTCKNGHVITPENAYFRKDRADYVDCRKCRYACTERKMIAAALLNRRLGVEEHVTK